MRLSHFRSFSRRGTTLVETGIVIGGLLMFLLAIFEYGRFVLIRHLLDNAAREGARQAVTNTATLTSTDIQNTVTTYLAGQPINVSSCNVYMADPNSGSNLGTWTSAGFGQGIAVDVTASYTPILPTLGFLPNPVPLHSKVIMLSEAN